MVNNRSSNIDADLRFGKDYLSKSTNNKISCEFYRKIPAFFIEKTNFWKCNFPINHNVCLSKKNVRILGKCRLLLLLFNNPSPPWNFHNMFHDIFMTCSHVHGMFTTCSRHVRFMFTTYSREKVEHNSY